MYLSIKSSAHHMMYMHSSHRGKVLAHSYNKLLLTAYISHFQSEYCNFQLQQIGETTENVTIVNGTLFIGT